MPKFSDISDCLVSCQSTNIIWQPAISHYFAWFWRIKDKWDAHCPWEIFFLVMERRNEGRGRISPFLIWSELAIFFFFVKDKIHITIKLRVRQSLYFTHKNSDTQRQGVIFFQVHMLPICRWRMKILCFL